MTVETMKITLTRPALERLIGGEPWISLELKKQVCREIVDKHFKSLANEELWRLSHGMTEMIAVEVEKVVKGFVDGTKDPTGRWKWFSSYPHCDTVNQMIAKACEKYFNDTIQKMAVESLEKWLLKDETIDAMIQRKVNSLTTQAVSDLIAKKVQAKVDAAVMVALQEIPEVKFKTRQRVMTRRKEIFSMTSEIPRPTWSDCRSETHFKTASSLWKRGMEWRKCKRCDRIAENAVQFGSKVTNVYCQSCTCNECGIELEGYEETACQSCCENYDNAKRQISKLSGPTHP